MNTLHFNNVFLLNSPEAWEIDANERFNLKDLNRSFRQSVPVLEYIDWKIIDVKRGYVETLLPLNPQSSNQYITHQAALMLLSADYTGGLALTTLLHSVPIVGFWSPKDDYSAYMWGAKSSIKWHSPSYCDLICKAKIEKDQWDKIYRRFSNSQKVAFTVRIEMFNGDKLVAESDFTYWIQDIYNLRKNAFDVHKIDMLYRHKTRTTAKLIAGLRALEQEKSVNKRKFDDPYAFMMAGKHGITLARKFISAIPQIQEMVAERTKNLDDSIGEFTKDKNAFNVVNIGSGYDELPVSLNNSCTL